MGGLRTILNSRPAVALLLIVAALMARALVPAGYMPGEGGRVLTLMLCSDTRGQTTQVVLPASDSSTPDDDDTSHRAMPCAFGALAMASLAGADPVLLAIAIAHVVALGLAPVVILLYQGRLHLRPPLRGPPVLS